MGIDDKLKEGLGKAKEAFGDATDNERIENEGKADQLGAQAGDKLDELKNDAKDAFDGAAAKIKDATDGK